MSLTVSPLKANKQHGEFDLFEELINSITESRVSIQNGDVIVISSKYISNAQERLVEINKIQPSPKSKKISKKFKLESKIAEVIIRESDIIFGGISGFVITSSDGILAPNAGIDKSNAEKGRVILYPDEPYKVAEQIKRKIFLRLLKHVGIIIVDSRLMPSRVGTVGIAIACAGIEPVLDLRAQKDLHGNPLKVTFQAVADNLATMANHKMGEGSESQPFAIISNSNVQLTDRRIMPNEMAISHDQCVFIRGFKNS